MQLSKAEQHAVEATKKILTARHNTHANQRQEVESFNERRHNAAREFKQNLFDQALQAAKIDHEALSRRQRRDEDSGLDFLAKQKEHALKKADKVNQKNAADFSKQVSLWNKITADTSSAIVVATLETAAGIVIYGPGTTSIAPDENLAFTQAMVDSGGYLGGPFKGQIVSIDWLFVWTPPRPGFMNVTSFLSLNGVSALWTHATCDGGSAFSTIDAYISLGQGNNLVSFPGNRIFDRIISSPWGNSVGVADFFTLDETDTVGNGTPTHFPVAAEIPVSIAVEVQLYVSVWNALADLDFMSGEFRLNVPYVFLSLV
jgi:hypothetical protein